MFVLAYVFNILLLEAFHSFSDSFSNFLLSTYYVQSTAKYWGHATLKKVDMAFNTEEKTEQVIVRACCRAEYLCVGEALV